MAIEDPRPRATMMNQGTPWAMWVRGLSVQWWEAPPQKVLGELHYLKGAPAETNERWAGPAETKERWTLRAPGTERPLERTLRAPGTERALERTLRAPGTERALERTLRAPGTERALERTWGCQLLAPTPVVGPTH